MYCIKFIFVLILRHGNAKLRNISVIAQYSYGKFVFLT